jgi:hypothetical protein
LPSVIGRDRLEVLMVYGNWSHSWLEIYKNDINIRLVFLGSPFRCVRSTHGDICQGRLGGRGFGPCYAYSYFCNHHHPCSVRVWRWQVEQPFHSQREDLAFSGFIRIGHRGFVGLLLSSIEGWRCLEGRPGDKLSLLLVAIFAFIFSMSALHSRNGLAFFWSVRASWYSVSRNELPITYSSSVAFCHLSRFLRKDPRPPFVC